MAPDKATTRTITTGLQRRELCKALAFAGSVVSAMSLHQSAVAGPAPMWVPAEMPSPASATEGTVDVGGVKLWYWDTGGNGQPVVFMHAGSQSGAGWGYQQPAFAAAGFRAIGYSRRGYFRSESGDPEEPGLASEDLNRLIEHLKLDKVHIVAIAHGAFFTLDFALTYAQKIRSLTIASSFLGIADSETDYLEVNRRLRPKEFNALPVEFKELHPSYRAGNPAGMAAWIKLAQEARNGPQINAKRPYPLTWKRLESIKAPTLLMTGDGDLYTPPALLRMQALHMPHAEAVIVPEAGHCANWEQPAFFNRTVLDFLRRHKA